MYEIGTEYERRAPRELADCLRYHEEYEHQADDLARNDPAYFVERCFSNERTGKGLKNKPFHREWHRFMSANRRAIISASVEFGKSIHCAARTIWELGRDPTLRILVIGASDAAAEKTGSQIRRHLELNEHVRRVFPELRRSEFPGDPWTTSDMRVAGASLAKDPSIQCRSVGSRNILGSRLDLVIVDDLLNPDNTMTKYARDKLSGWFDDVVLTRVYDDWEAGRFGRVWINGNPWDSDDLMARLGRLPGWATMTTPAVLNPDDPPERWVPAWPEQWPIARLLDRYRTFLPRAFARKFLCRVLDVGNRRFALAWLAHALDQGSRRTQLFRQPTENGRPLRCFVGVDPAFGKKDVDALSAAVTLAVDSRCRRIVADVRSGHWSGPELLRQVEELTQRFDAEAVVEGNAAQRWLAEFGTEMGICARSVNTGSEKWDEEYGVESIAVRCRDGMLVIPSEPLNGVAVPAVTGHVVDPEVAELVREMYDFNPAAHTGDRLMALWIAEKGVREYLEPRGGTMDTLRR